MNDSILNGTAIYNYLVEKKSTYINTVNAAAKFAKNKLDLTVKVFESYTTHNIDHSKKVMDYMYKLANNRNSISDEEIVIIIHAALFHDIGMALSEKEIQDIKNGAASNGSGFNYDFEKVLKVFGNDERAAITGLVRSHHGNRSAKLIKSCINSPEMVNGMTLNNIFSFCLPNSEVQISFADYLAAICESHEQSISWIETNIKHSLNLYNNISINGQYIACLLRLADLLDFDCDRAPKFYEWIRTIEPSSKEFFYINQMVFPGEKIHPYNEKACRADCPNLLCCGKSQLIIKISGGYPDHQKMTQSIKEEMYGKCLEYFEYTEREIQTVLDIAKTWNDSSLTIDLCSKISIELNKPEDLAIDPPKKLEVEYPVIRDLFLGENLYKDKKIGLRELLQNAYDACTELCETYIEINDRDKMHITYTPTIRVIIDHTTNAFRIQDNGVGMSFSTITNCFLHVGKSIYEGDKYRYTNFHRNHIGHFGIGFFAAYMLSTHVEIVTKHYLSSEEITTRLTKHLEYVTIVKKEAKTYAEPGTSINLILDEVMDVFESIDNIKLYITENFIQTGISVNIEVVNADQSIERECLSLRSVGSINIPTGLEIDKVDLSMYFNDVTIVAHLSYDKSYQSEIHSIKEERNFLYDGARFVEVEFSRLEEYIVSCKKQICFYKIVQAECNLFVPEQYWLDDQAPFGFEGYIRNVNISYPDLPIYDEYRFSDFMCDTGIHFKIPGRASVQGLNVLGDEHQSGLFYFERNKEFKRNALVLYLNQACGEADRIDTVFIRNVLIPNIHLKIPFLPYGVNVANINCNIFTDNVFPTTDRLDAHSSIKEMFSYAVGKALTLNYLQQTDDVKEKKNIKEFIDKYYEKDNIFLCTPNC